MVLKRDKLSIISEILQKCIGGATKTAIVYQVNLNFKTVNPYLDLLIARGLLEVSQGSTVTYTTTEKGVKLLEDLKRVHDVLKETPEQD
ncbi:MAG: winged helix-turn-helix domain-containing protein [Methanothrix sp.]|uniref:winged helix-turn-helix domain-containing protein n=1 Tax=Methanothrix sp. TaxID=90426 RepID=UPI00261CBCD1|nr:winged helix-turn-helix domain-containing protein [Methanothrix sp.]MCX8207082.1 winged helix-turn-helix domain-containing protein [Methanothrix sp.]MDI9616005.1 winged helix-turn-helix domain-containing protein [Methanothrix sp.]